MPSFEPLSRILPKAINRAGISKQVTAARVVEKAAHVLRALWGEEKAAHVEMVSFKDGVLKLKTHSGPASQELKLWELRLVNQMNRELGSRVVQKLEVRS